jgi:hypothetical protein
MTLDLTALMAPLFWGTAAAVLAAATAIVVGGWRAARPPLRIGRRVRPARHQSGAGTRHRSPARWCLAPRTP